MLARRRPHEATWQRVGDYLDPFAAQYLRQTTGSNHERPLPSRSKIINSAAVGAVATMDAGFMGGHTSKARPWFRLGVSDPVLGELAEVKAWLDDCTQAIRDTLARSNFYTALPVFYHDRHLFGVAALSCEEDPTDVIRFYVRPCGTYAVSIGARGRADALWYSYEASASDLVDRFGDSTGLPADVRARASGGSADKMHVVNVLVEANPKAKRGAVNSKERPFRVVQWLEGTAEAGHGCLYEEGVYEFPTFVGRWNATGNLPYCPSPAINALGDIAQLQYLESEKLRLIDLISKPPLAAPEHLRNKGASLTPGSMVYVTPLQTQQQVTPIYTPSHGALQQVMAEIATVENRVKAAFFADLFRMLDYLDDRQRTAYEISERKEEKIAMLGPQLESLTDEVLDPVIERVYAILDRLGRLPMPPDALNNIEVKVEYTSMLAQSQKAAGTGTIERVLGIAANMAVAAQDPTAWDKIDMDQVLDEVHAQQGAPARILRSDADVAQMRSARQQQQQMQQMAAMAPALKQGAEALKVAGQAKAEQGSMLDSLAGVSAGA